MNLYKDVTDVGTYWRSVQRKVHRDLFGWVTQGRATLHDILRNPGNPSADTSEASKEVIAGVCEKAAAPQVDHPWRRILIQLMAVGGSHHCPHVVILGDTHYYCTSHTDLLQPPGVQFDPDMPGLRSCRCSETWGQRMAEFS